MAVSFGIEAEDVEAGCEGAIVVLTDSVEILGMADGAREKWLCALYVFFAKTASFAAL